MCPRCIRMGINEYLKSIGKTKIELSNDLQLSRPTLNAYIELFEKGKVIDNERYQIIFDRLFSNDLPRETFEQKLASAKFLLARDKEYHLSDLEPEAADCMMKLYNLLTKDLEKKDWNEKVYDFICMTINSYRSNELIRELAGYFSDLNSNSNPSTYLDSSKAYYSYYYKMFKRIVDSAPQFDAESYDAFLRRKQEQQDALKSKAREKKKRVEELLRDALKQADTELREQGIDASEDELIAEVMRKVRDAR